MRMKRLDGVESFDCYIFLHRGTMVIRPLRP